MAMMGRLTTMKADKLFIVFGRKREIRLRSAKRLCKRMTKRRMKSRQNMKQALSTTLGRCAAAVFLLALLQSTFDTSTFAHAFCLRQRTACQHQLAKFCNPSDTLVRSRLLPDHHRQQRKPLFTDQKVLLEKQDFQQGLYATTVVSNDSKPCGCSVEASHHAHHHHHGSHGARQTTITSLSIVLWVLSMLSHGAPLLGHHGQHVLSKLRFAALPSVALAMPTVVAKAKHALFERRKIDASCMMLAASIGALALGEYTESAAVTSLFAVSEVLEDRAANHSASALSQVAQDIGPGRARLLVVSDDQIVAGDAGAFHNNTLKQDQEVAATSEQTIDVSADQVNVGALVSVPVGDKIPCDGVVLSGNTFLDESSVSGESRPLRRSTDNTVSAGSVNVGPERIVVRTTAMASESAVARLAKLVEDSLSQKSPTEVMIDKFAGRYAPFVFSMALFMAILPWAFSSRETGLVWTRRGLVTMVAACPCPLVISTPVSYIAALAVMAREGVIVKGGAVLEVSLHLAS
jgi:cation transport ATPase